LAPQIARHRVSASPDVIGAVRVSSPGTQLSRDLRTVHAMPMPTARLRSQGAALDSRSAIRPTTPGEGARVRIPERSSNGRPDGQGRIGHATDRNGLSSDTPSRRWYNDRPVPRGQSGRTIDQGGTGHATDRNGLSTDTPARRWYNERPVPRGQSGRTMDSGGLNDGSSTHRRLDTPPSTTWRGRESDVRGRPSLSDRPLARESAPRVVERAMPQASRPVPSQSRDYGSGFGNRSFQPSRERPVPRSESSTPPRLEGGPRYSQPHDARPQAEPRSAPPPAEAARRDRHPHDR
jgi:hypothetical protein